MSSENSLPFVTSVLHPTDFSETSERAFAHALAISLVRQTRLAILHAGGSGDGDWSDFPAVRGTLERWGLLAPESSRNAVFDDLAVRIVKIDVPGNPVDATLEEIDQQAVDLVVVATEGRDGIARFLRPSVAQAIGRESAAHGAMTLFVPAEGPGFVRPEDGHLSLRRILIPVARTPDANEAVTRAQRAAAILGDGDVVITLLHIGDEFPAITAPTSEGSTREEVSRSADDAVGEILRVSSDYDLIVMATDGRDVMIDAVRGSHTERVVREAACPVLAVPAT